VKVIARTTPTHNPSGEVYWASGLRGNLTSRSYGEGLETGRTLVQAPRQSFTRQVFFRVFEQGCQVEQLRLQTKPRLVNALALYLIVAWRIHTLTRLSRAYPEVSCEGVFEPQEWQTLYTRHYRRRPPQEPPPLREMVRCLARLGGFLARTGDGEPGVQTLWQGYRRLQDFLYALETQRAVNAP